ncbi:hypothetical protein M0765_004270 [Variovorax sp. S2]|uniref:hypothetical protein n=1 Tax=Variovorax sp. S12S4 TaxID=3029170 RepID=UPI00215C1849|nr:hypothetical protein [Variovorax sp. S12S4]MCR8956979.1 hypothetical protein [Variovorax sp. S12S4]
MSFVLERTTSMLTVRECSSIEILRIELRDEAVPLFAPGMQVIFPAQTEPVAKDSKKRSGSASLFA